MRALLIFFFLAVSACAAQKVQTLPAVKPSDAHVTDASGTAGDSAPQPSAGEGQAQPQQTVLPAWGGVWGPLLPTDRRHHGHTGGNPSSNQGRYPGYPSQFPSFPGQFPTFPGQFPTFPGQFPSFPGQFPGSNPGQFPSFPGQFPGQFPGSNPGQFPGVNPGQFPGFVPQQPFPGSGR